MENKNTEQVPRAHANFKKGLEDYNDGANTTHHLGNESYDGASIPEDDVDEAGRLSGYEAQGNGLTEEDLEDEDDELPN